MVWNSLARKEGHFRPWSENISSIYFQIDSGQFKIWLRDFLPLLFNADFDLVPGEVIDRTDGKLVHLDGLNFSRAWSLYSILMSLDQTISNELRYFSNSEFTRIVPFCLLFFMCNQIFDLVALCSQKITF